LTLRLSTLQQQAESLVTEQLPVPHTSPFHNHPLGDTHARTLTGASIVAVLRDGVPTASPTPDFVLLGGDLVITVGTREGVDQVARILDGTEPVSAPPGTVSS
jgi:TrkA domain protein